jgi:hypothetical protein
MKFEPIYVTPEQDKLLRDNGFGDYTPEQWMAVEWIRVKHNIWISDVLVMDRFSPKLRYMGKAQKIILDARSLSEEFGMPYTTGIYDTPKEAISSAIDMVLKEVLISDICNVGD